MSAPSRSTWVLLALALAIGLAEPYLELAWRCRNGFATSEACVWGRSYLPLSRAAGLLLVAPIAFLALWIVRHIWRRRGGESRPSG
jgi:hypothetical protein